MPVLNVHNEEAYEKFAAEGEPCEPADAEMLGRSRSGRCKVRAGADRKWLNASKQGQPCSQSFGSVCGFDLRFYCFL